MHLKMSVREALLKIDSLLKEGVEIMDWIRGEDWDDFRMPIISSLEDHEELNKKEPPRPSIFDESLIENIEFVETKLKAWNKKCIKVLRTIFIDEAHIYRFRSALKKESVDRKYNKDYLAIELPLESKLDVLSDYYFDLYPLIKAAISYDPESAKLHYYDFVQELEPGSNEADLCSCLFKKGIGEKVDYADVYAYIKGANINEQDRWDKDWKKVIRNAYDGINKKTNKRFGFNLISKEDSAICLNFPSRFFK